MPTRQLSNPEFQILQSVFNAANHPADPKTSITNAARATTIVGRMLQSIADDRFPQASPFARRLTQFGILAYGLVELSAPRGIRELFFIYWINLFFVVGLLISIIGAVLTRPPVWQVGLIILLVVWALDCIRTGLRRFMVHGGFPFRTVAGRVALLIVLVILVRPGWPLHALQSVEHPLLWLQGVESHPVPSVRLAALWSHR